MWENLPELLKPYLNAVVIGIIGILLAVIVSQLTTRLLLRPIGKGWSRFIGNLVALAVIVWTIKLILDSAGAAGLVIVLVTTVTGAFALGSERFAGDLIAGISLFLSKSYKVGDSVQLAETDGEVVDISLMTTILQNQNGDRFFIRNADVTDNLIVNYADQPTALISVKLALPSSQDINAAVQAIEKAIQGFSPEITENTHQPCVVIESSAMGYTTLEVQAHVTSGPDDSYRAEKTRLFLLASNAVKKAGIQL
jgi:small-conductance mechanosensitive channel